MKKIQMAAAILIAGLFLGLPALAQNCSQVQFRLWRADEAPVWASPGETFELYSGEQVHLYIHQTGRSGSHYSTTADIGYPANFGHRDDSLKVRKHLRMEAQNGDDKRSGRVRLTAEQAGSARLGYRITGVKSPGDLNRIPGPCRTGVVNFRVLERTAPAPPPPAPPEPPASQGDAALGLVEVLYKGLLRRDRTASDPDDFVRQVWQFGKGGLERIAETMTVSPEFRYEALKRTEAAHGRSGFDELRRQLLDDIYRDLYGYLTPSRQDRQADLDDLDQCLSNDREAERACSRLGRNLVDSDLFYEQNRNLIDRLPNARSGRRR